MSEAAPCVELPWDTEFFGRRIGRVRVERLTGDALRRVREWADRERSECLYCLVDTRDPEGIRHLERSGFRLVDTRITLTRPFEDVAGAGPPPDDVWPARPSDLPALVSIARAGHGATRFYRDPHFPDERCAELYARWIEESCRGWADAVLVAGDRGEPRGYLTCHRDEEGWGRIGLFAVAPEVRGRGLAARLLAAGLGWFARADARAVRVATQASNVAGLRTYERAGFRITAVEHWYHWWRTGEARGGSGG